MKLNIIFNKYYFVCVKNCMQHCYFLFALQSKLYNIIYKNCHECLSNFVKNHSLLVVGMSVEIIMFFFLLCNVAIMKEHSDRSC